MRRWHLLGSMAALVAACREPNRSPPQSDAGLELPPVPTIPVGLDAYRQWDRLADVRIGVRAYMRSTYDRSGGNEGSDASHFLRSERDDFNVTLDTVGPGVLYFTRTNHWHGSPWHDVIDGNDHVIAESSTADPDHPVASSIFLPQSALPEPLVYTWSTTRGADLDWVPKPFDASLVLAYGRTHYGTGYYIFHRFPEGSTDLSQPIASWDESPPDADVLAWIGRAGSDIAPSDPGMTVREGSADVDAGQAAVLADFDGPAAIRALRLRIASSQADALAGARIRVSWDDRSLPSIDAPVALFFGAGTLYRRDTREFLVKGLLANVRFDPVTGVELSMYYPMPFYRRAHVEIVAGEQPLTGLAWHLRAEPRSTTVPFGYFHATYTDVPVPTPGQDMVLLDTRTAEPSPEGGEATWCGSFVGMSWTFSDRALLTTLEGDPRFFFDDSQSPQAYGTGTEEWGGGGDYWGGQTMTLPFAGHPVGAPSLAEAQNPTDAIESAYRFLLADAMPFGKNARIQLEHGGLNDSDEHYRSVSYWYGLPGACLELDDTFHVGDADDERLHAYSSPTASPVQTLRSRYEWGVDHLDGVEVIPETEDTGRAMTGTSEMTFRINEANRGVMLRRKLDYGYPDQRAEVFVADDRPGSTFEHAGTWYLAGSNACVYSNPPGELSPPDFMTEISNRRFREDEFLVPRRLTEGRAAIRVRIQRVAGAFPLTPMDQPREQAWSEYRYAAYSYVIPTLP